MVTSRLLDKARGLGRFGDKTLTHSWKQVIIKTAAQLVPCCRAEVRKPLLEARVPLTSASSHTTVSTWVRGNHSRGLSSVLFLRSLWHLPRLVTIALKLDSPPHTLSKAHKTVLGVHGPWWLTFARPPLSVPPRTPHLRILLSSTSNPLSML